MPDFSLLIETLVPRLVAMLALVFVVTLSGVIRSVVKKEFQLAKLGDFLGSMVLPKVGGWLLLEVLAFFVSPAVIPVETGMTDDILTGLGWAAYTAAFGSLLAQFLANLHEMGVLENYTKYFSRAPEKGGG